MPFGLRFFDLRSGEECKKPNCKLLLVLGNFDGVHRGHAALIRHATNEAEKIDARPGVWCFLTPPADSILSNAPPHICTLRDKLRLFALEGAEYAVLGDFDELRDLDYVDFIKLLRDECGCVGTVCSFNFRFGKDGKGTPYMLEESFGEHAYTVPPVCFDGEPISSSRIRRALLSGDAEYAENMLGRPFFVSGEVVHGKSLGRELGLPTANQRFGEKMLVPKNGIYASMCVIDGKEYMAVSNIGCRPTVENDGSFNCETHIMGFSGDIYGKEIRVYLYKKLRDEIKFDSLEELRAAIENDVCLAVEYFENRARR